MAEVITHKRGLGGCGCIVAITALFLVGIASFMVFGNRYVYSEGARSGTVNKLSHKGLIWKSWEGEMALEGIAKRGDNIGANLWQFSIDNQARHGEDIAALQAQLDSAMRSGARVNIRYIQQLSSWPWRASTTYMVQSVEIVPPTETSR